MDLNLFYKILLVLLSYLLGSFPTAFLIFKAHKGEDIRTTGSGNAGGTNVLRSAGSGLGSLTIIIDLLKGVVPILVLYLFFPSSSILFIITSVAVLLGHVFPVFLKFKGGKGVSTTGGMIIATCVLPFSDANLALRLAPAIIIVSAVLVTFFITRIMSLGSIIAAIITPLMFWLFRYDFNPVVISGIIWAIVVVVCHRENIKRLFKGEEKKILIKKKEG
jgi:glycerol-3-phosphate acyltransferase PlsY